MNATADNLMQCLEEELRFNTGLYELGQRKRTELIQQDVDAVERTNREEQAMLGAMGETAARRVKCSQILAKELAVPEEEATIRGLAARLPDESRKRMHQLALDLRESMMKVRRITESNRLLTEQSLKYVQDFFEILTGGNTGANTYGRSGRQDNQPGRLMIDQVV